MVCVSVESLVRLLADVETAVTDDDFLMRLYKTRFCVMVVDDVDSEPQVSSVVVREVSASDELLAELTEIQRLAPIGKLIQGPGLAILS